MDAFPINLCNYSFWSYVSRMVLAEACSLAVHCVKNSTCFSACIGRSFPVNLSTMFVAFSVPEWLFLHSTAYLPPVISFYSWNYFVWTWTLIILISAVLAGRQIEILIVSCSTNWCLHFFYFLEENFLDMLIFHLLFIICVLFWALILMHFLMSFLFKELNHYENRPDVYCSEQRHR